MKETPSPGFRGATPPGRSSAPIRERRSRAPKLAAVLIAAAVIAVLWWLFSSHAGRKHRNVASERAAQPVSTQAARRQDVRVMVGAIGSIAANNTAVVRAQVAGVLNSLSVKEGQQVQAGQQIAQIDPKTVQDTTGPAEGALARDQAQLDSAKVDLARYQDLYAKDAIAKQQVDTQAALVRQLEGTVKADTSSVGNARLTSSYTVINAPISGRVGLKQADLGNIVGPGDVNGIVTIAQTKPISLIFSIPASNLPQITARLHAGSPVPVEAWDSGGKQRLATGQVLTLDNAIDPATDTIKAKAQFPNGDDALFPNQAVTVRLQLEKLPNALVVPQAAVLNGAGGAYVYVVNADDTVSAQHVVPGAVDGDWVAVDGPIQPGQPIVVDGVDRIRDGAKVEVIAKPANADAASTAASGGSAAPAPTPAPTPAPGADAGAEPPAPAPAAAP